MGQETDFRETSSVSINDASLSDISHTTTSHTDDRTRALTRRALLGKTALYAGAAAIGTHIPWWMPDPTYAAESEYIQLKYAQKESSASKAAWRDLSRKVKGIVLRPSDPGYATYAPVANPRYSDMLPAGILLPAHEKDVNTGVAWSQKHRIPVVARGGGHSYAGYSATQGLLLHTASLKGAVLDAEQRTIRVRAGMHNGEVNKLLYGTGLTFPSGRCPEVGIGGYLLGGGISMHSRRLGMGCDSLLSTRVVTSGGEVLACDAQQNADLYWACRGGGGGNFGINTEFTVELYEAPTVVLYDLEWKNGTQNELLLAAMHELITDPALSRKLEAQFWLQTTAPKSSPHTTHTSVYAQGWYYGSRSELERVLSRVLAVATPDRYHVAEVNVTDAQRYFAHNGEGKPYLATSLISSKAMTLDDIHRLMYYTNNWNREFQQHTSVSFFAMGGKESTLSASDTAFAHRDAGYILCATAYWSRGDHASMVEESTRWIDDFRHGMSAVLGSGSYVNFPGPTLQEWQNAYYGSNYERLVSVKSTYDPVNLFRYPQSIETL